MPPIVGNSPRVLVLGSLPGTKSLEAREYYANPGNAFWRIMGDLFDAGPGLAYPERAARLADLGIAVWDVLASSVREGSMDSAIIQSTAVANDFASFLGEHSDVRLICFNGQTAGKLFARQVLPGIAKPGRSIDYRTLPSTSPAHAAMRYEEKLDRWSFIRQYACNRRNRK